MAVYPLIRVSKRLELSLWVIARLSVFNSIPRARLYVRHGKFQARRDPGPEARRPNVSPARKGWVRIRQSSSAVGAALLVSPCAAPTALLESRMINPSLPGWA